MMGERDVKLICAHCGNEMQGNAGLTTGGVHHHLCHPDTGMDCYRLVTVYRHPIVACPCKNRRLTDDEYRVRENGYVGKFQTIDQALDAIATAIREGARKE